MNKKILIVEDNPQNMRLVEMALSTGSYTLLEATNGEEALEVAKKEHPDLIIMDIQLPKMSGLEVTRKLREIPEFTQTPIIAVTAYAMKGDEKKALDAGCNAYLSKPISARDLPNLVAKMLARRQEEKE
ncbi:MAG: response regulator [Syntrophaceae bacterium]|nr:response regulator [Syntrophaceae bacterium]